MADTQERPAKIRKIDYSSSDNVLPQEISSPSVASDPISVTKDNSNSVHHKDETAEAKEATTTNNAQDSPQISKSQLKKLRKRQLWEATKDSRKALQKEKLKQKKARKAEERAAQNQDGNAASQPPNPRTYKRPVQVPLGLILDCDFDDLMTEKEIISLGAQLTRCYHDNRTSPYRAHMVVNSFGGQLKSRFENTLSNNQLGWKGVKFTEKDFVEAAADLHDVMRSREGGKLVGAFYHSDDYPTKGEETEVTPMSDISQEPSENNSFKPSSALKAAEDSNLLESIQNTTDAFLSGTALENELSKPLGVEPEAHSAEKELCLPNPESSIKVGKPKPPKEPERSPTKEELDMKAPSIVYLTADSPNTIERLSPYTSYIIGGIVDKNRYKGLCYKRACERGIAHGKLPIGEYMTMQSRTVLTVNHVMEIMLKWLETGDWGEAFLRVIPKRKEAKLKIKKEQKDEDENEKNGGGGKDDDGGEKYEDGSLKDHDEADTSGSEMYDDALE